MAQPARDLRPVTRPGSRSVPRPEPRLGTRSGPHRGPDLGARQEPLPAAAPQPEPDPAPSWAGGADWRDLAGTRDLLVSYLVPRCRDEHEAEDLSHETLLRAARFRRSLDDPSRLRAWLVQIAANLHRDHVRRESRLWFLPLDEPEYEELEALEYRGRTQEADGLGVMRVADREYTTGDALAALERAWRELSDRDRAVLDGFYREGGSASVAAREGAVRREAVKVALHRARRRLEARIRMALRSAELDLLATRCRLAIDGVLRS